MTDIDAMLADLITREGGYANNPADRGGPTRYGITQATARANGYMGEMVVLPVQMAMAIYKVEFWTAPHLDLVDALAPRLAAEMFDTAVNCGPATAIMLAQRALNVLAGSTLLVDGKITPNGSTLNTLAAFLKARPRDGASNLLVLVNCFQGERYAELVERDPTQRAFINGWIANRVELTA